jgi:prefoldin subunit 5
LKTITDLNLSFFRTRNRATASKSRIKFIDDVNGLKSEIQHLRSEIEAVDAEILALTNAAVAKLQGQGGERTE